VEQTWICLNLILYPSSTNSITFCNRSVSGYVSLSGCQLKSSQTDRQTQDQKLSFYIFQTSKLYQVGHAVNSQWFLEWVENVNIKHYIKHSSPWQWYSYYFDSANFLANFICINKGCDVLFKTLVKVTWKWVIYYTADALKLLCRRQYRTRTLKKRYTEDKNIIILWRANIVG
jgi:hypothetical protein